MIANFDTISIVILLRETKKLLVLLLCFTAFISLHGVKAQAEPANINLTETSTNLHLSWTETSSQPVSDYKLEYSSDGGTTFQLLPYHPYSNTYYDFPLAPPSLTDTPFDVRITTVFTGGSLSAPVTADLSIPARSSFVKSTQFVAGTPQTVVSHSARIGAGLIYWLDGIMG